MKGSELLRTLAIVAAHPDNKHAPRVPISRSECEELLRLADVLDAAQNYQKLYDAQKANSDMNDSEPGDKVNEAAMKLIHLCRAK